MSTIDWYCADCREDTINEYYMVWNDIWSKHGAGEGLLCIGCLEDRMGRELVVNDFTNAPVNQLGNGWSKSPRLLERLTRYE